MPTNGNRQSLLIIFSVFSLIILATVIVSIFAQGYRLNLEPNGLPSIKATGLLSLTSHPKGAAVYLNGELITATDDTLNLPPNDYQLKVIKDGFLPWQKTIKIQKEIVSPVDIILFRSAPDLRSLTNSGAINPVVSPDNSKIIFAIASASAAKDNGLYLIDLNFSPLNLGKNTPRQIAPNFIDTNWSKASFTFSPDSRQILATLTPSGISYLLTPTDTISRQNLYDVSLSLSLIRQEWQRIENNLISAKLEKIPQELKSLISTQSAQNISYSTTDTKILYLAAADGTLPDNLKSPPPSRNSQPQTRSITKDHFYVYDLTEDTNYLLGPKSNFNNLSWLPNSDNLIFIENQTIKTIEYDATNLLTIFTDKSTPTILCPWLDGSRIITLTSPFGAPQNLYSITIRN